MNNQDTGKKPTSKRRQEASRANGAKSNGPVTPEGKQISSRNATTHGFLATLITLSPEDEETFRDIHDLYIRRFEPRDQVEHDIVEQIVVACFRMRQVWTQETAVLGLQISCDLEKVSAEWRAPSEYDRRALAFVESVKESNALSLLQRYGRSLASQAERAIKLLLELKKQRLPPAEVPALPEPEPEQRNEPSPEIEHLEIQPERQPEAPVAYIGHATRPVRIAIPFVSAEQSASLRAGCPRAQASAGF